MRLRASGEASAAVVWDRYFHPDRWPEWSPQIRRVDVSADRLVTGLTGTVRGPVGISARFVIESVDPETMTWSWRVWLGPLTFRLHHEVRPIPRGSETALRIEGAAPFVLAYAPVAQLALIRLVRP
jgi:hypothetical protein